MLNKFIFVKSKCEVGVMFSIKGGKPFFPKTKSFQYINDFSIKLNLGIITII